MKNDFTMEFTNIRNLTLQFDAEDCSGMTNHLTINYKPEFQKRFVEFITANPDLLREKTLSMEIKP